MRFVSTSLHVEPQPHSRRSAVHGWLWPRHSCLGEPLGGRLAALHAAAFGGGDGMVIGFRKFQGNYFHENFVAYN